MEAALHVRHRAVDAVLLPDNVILQLALAVKALQGTRLRRFGHAVAVFIAREKAEENFLRGYLIRVRAEGDILEPPASERQHVRHGQVVARHARDEQRVLPARQRTGGQAAQLRHRGGQAQRGLRVQRAVIPVVVIDARRTLFVAANN